MKNHGPEIHPVDVIWVPSSQLMLVNCKKKNDNLAVQYEDVHDSGTVDLSKCVRIKELEESKADKIESEPPKGPSEPYDERMKKDRSSYNAE